MNLMNWFPFKFKGGGKKYLGVDIGTSAIRIVQLSGHRGNFSLENYGEIKTSFSKKIFFSKSVENTTSFSNHEIAAMISDILKEAGIEAKEANFSIPDFSTFFINFELPPMSTEELVNAIRYEAKNYIPLPLSEVTLDWVITEGSTKSDVKEPLKILAVAVPNDIIIQYQRIAEIAGLKITTLEAEAFALSRALKENAKKITAIVDIGARSTTCNILENGVLKTSYSFNVSGNELTEIISKSLGIPYEKAEELKKEWGLKGSGEMADIREVLIPLIDLILNEVKKVLESFHQEEGKEVGKIILSGSSALLPGLKEYFSKRINKETEIANPFAKISYPPILKEVLQERGPSYAIAVGIAMEGFFQTK